MAGGTLSGEMVATYQVTINGFPETKAALRRLDGAIARLRAANYSGGALSSATTATSSVSGLSSSRIFEHKIVNLEGRVKSATQKAMAKSMAHGRRVQVQALEDAVTAKGASGKPAGRAGPGRNVTGSMIRGVKTNVETLAGGSSSLVTGWHGWQAGAPSYFTFQEEGTGGRGQMRTTKSGRQMRMSAGAAEKANVLYRKPNTPKRGSTHRGGGVPAANSLGTSIIAVREHLTAELMKIKGVAS